MSQHLSIFVTNADDQAMRGAWVTVCIDGKEIVHAQTNGRFDQPISITLPDTLSAIKLRAVAGPESKEATVPVDTHNYTFKFENVHGPTVADPTTPKAIWIPALAFTSVLLLFFIFVFFKVPTMTEDQKGIIGMLFPPFCGFSAFFMGGTALFALDFPKNKFVKIAFSATAGIAVFAFTWSHAPYWFKVNKANISMPYPQLPASVKNPQSNDVTLESSPGPIGTNLANARKNVTWMEHGFQSNPHPVMWCNWTYTQGRQTGCFLDRMSIPRAWNFSQQMTWQKSRLLKRQNYKNCCFNRTPWKCVNCGSQ